MNNQYQISWPVQVARGLAILCVMTAATNTEVFTILFDVFATGSRLSCPTCFVVIYNFLFFASPFVALIGLLMNKKWGFWGLYISPLMALKFEVSIIPFTDLLFNIETSAWSTFVTFSNVLFLLASWMLMKHAKKLSGL